MISSLDAAYQILNSCGDALHYKEITKRIVDQALWHSKGETPDATVNSKLAKDIKEKGSKSVFQRTAQGTYGLRSWGLPEYLGKKKNLSGNNVEKKHDHPINEVKMTFNDAAEYVLEHYGHQEPLHYQKITEKILELGLVNTEGKTPEATLYAQIINEIKRNLKRGETPRFVKHGKGLIGLQKWLGEGLAFQIKSHNEEARKKLHKKLYKISPADFEALIAQLLVALGFVDVVVTNISNDGGIDVRGTLVVGDVIKTRMAVQVKRWKKNVQAPIVQQVRGSLSTHEQGLIITTSDFSKGAYEEAQLSDKIPVGLMNGKQLIALLIENDIGIHRTSYDLIDLTAENEVND